MQFLRTVITVITVLFLSALVSRSAVERLWVLSLRINE